MQNVQYSLTQGFRLSNQFFAPEEILRAKCGHYYENYPLATRVVAVPLAAITGIVKTLLFAVWALVGVVVLPIIAAIKAYQGKEPLKWMGAWAFSILGVAAVVGFLMVSAFHLQVTTAGLIFMGGVTISVCIHVYRACSAPSKK